VIFATVIAYEAANPDQLPFTWPSVGKGAIISAARVAIRTYERGGTNELNSYLDELQQDTGLQAGLFDSVGRELGIGIVNVRPPTGLATYPEGQLMIETPGRSSGIRLSGPSGRSYAFVAKVPRRERSGFWSRTFLFSLILTGALVCGFLAHHITAPVVHLRAVASKFSQGDLSARITLPNVLRRRDEIGGLAGDFNQMATQIERLMKAQQRLIADVSHELRSPLTRLGLALGLVRKHVGGEVGALGRMERELDRLNTLIGQLLTLSRLEGVEKPPPMETLDLSGLVKEISADADFEAASMDCGVQLLQCDPCSMLGARDLIRSALENVVRNAVKYTRPNTDVLIRLQAAEFPRAASIIVQDHGPGVPVEALPHIFEPFYRADDARDRGSGGSGLGLAITQQIVKLHGGSVIAVNRAEGGLELRMTLPIVGQRDQV
jgi:two-component system sensor histidine kinase CpxA